MAPNQEKVIMRIGIVGSTGKDSLESNLLEAFNSLDETEAFLIKFPLGSKTSRMSFLRSGIKKLLQSRLFYSLNEFYLMYQVKKMKINHVLVLTGAAAKLRPTSIEKARKIVQNIFCWHVDSIINMNIESVILSNYDVIFVVDSGLKNYLDLIGVKNIEVLYEGFLPSRHRPIGIANKFRSIAVVGSLYQERIFLLERLVRDGYPISIYGFGLPRWYRDGPLTALSQNRYVTYEEKSRVFHEHVCVLNTFLPSHIDAINCRVFEALASGAVVVSQYSDSIKNFFGGKEALFTFESYEELCKILDNILQDPEKTNQMRINAVSSVASQNLLSRAKFLQGRFLTSHPYQS